MRRVAALVALLLLGCSGKPDRDSDADVEVEDVLEEADLEDLAGEEAVTGPAGPEPAALPVMGPCPDGWREVEDEASGVTTCEPWPEEGRADCAADEVHLPGEPGCRRIGPECPTGDFASDLPTDRTVLYVLEGAPPGGDGALTSPFADLGDAVLASSDGDVIALGKGTYETCLTVGRAVEIRGACVEQTRLTCSEILAGTAITVTSPGVSLSRVSIGGDTPALLARSGGGLDLEDVLVDGATGIGVTVRSSSSVTGRNVVVRGTRASPGEDDGMGILVAEGGRMDLERAALEDNMDAGIRVAYSGTRVTLTRSVVSDTQPDADGDNGIGLDAGLGPEVIFDAVALEGNHECGIQAHGEGTSVTLTGSVVRGTRPRMLNLTMGAGVNVHYGALVTLERTLVEANLMAGVIPLQSGQAVLRDVVVRDTLPREFDDLFGRGINVQSGSHIDAARVLVSGNHDVGVFLGDCTAVIEDLTVLDTVPQPGDSTGGRGISITEAAEAEIHRVLLERNCEIALAIHTPGTRATITDLVARDSISRLGDERQGRGIEVALQAVVDIDRVLLERNREASVIAGGVGTILTMSNVTVLDTLESGCATSSCPSDGGGTGIVAIGGASIEVTAFLVDGGALCGVQVACGASADGEPFDVHGSLDLHHGVVSNNPIGANVQDDGFDIERLMDGVAYVDNDRNLDSTFLPVPGSGL
jgi:hypothetical protein